MIWLLHHPLPHPIKSVSWTGDTQETEKERDNLLREREEGAAKGAKSYDDDKA
jgi:hypothetical protein